MAPYKAKVAANLSIDKMSVAALTTVPKKPVKEKGKHNTFHGKC